MEIPSSSPIYTPLNDEKHHKIDDLDECRQVLFPDTPIGSSVPVYHTPASEQQAGTKRRSFELNISPSKQHMHQSSSVHENHDDALTQKQEYSEVPESMYATLSPLRIGNSPSRTVDPSILKDAGRTSLFDQPRPTEYSEIKRNDGFSPLIDSTSGFSSSEAPDLTQKEEETIFSDCDTTEDEESMGAEGINADMSTQNYLDDLLTKSLLESLPPPPAKRLKLDSFAGS